MNWAAAYNWTEKYIQDLPIGEFVQINQIEKAGRKIQDTSAFIECAKQYIDWYGDAEFSKDYSAIKRIPPIPAGN